MQLIFSAVTHADSDTLWHWRNRPAVRQFMYTQHEISHDEHQAWFSHMLANTHRYFYIVYKRVDDQSEKPLGVVNLDLDSGNRTSATWAFYAAPDAPRGSGALMEFGALSLAFETLGVTQLNCEVLSHNQGVVRLHQRFGFRETPQSRQRTFSLPEGKTVEIVCLSLSADEWQQGASALQTKLNIDAVYEQRH
ncbi:MULTISPECIES: UDP-4-amino-4,6-dideoxy-N-acetyl-beta-L-altrosamine N-acetyltransferase [unclassified Salinivibrio]|uniref:UDP-4-amino-4, 6-dideoxy-N-acetyl-beta-L-altrosamine N-acetyltransferase n=1 Tax=unclassified Salinivibrio TaxID=2636825 RepID=UPI00128DD8B5|nr:MULTISPECIES: UDP-4-amino-4,6-dideoxy-N-acetyl-beta-L-altrosamine N-acetyltransferase [unclassified Salinivibrio]MPS32460.1 UDP-4-amino-4,6-dideoxy-N-acetyl-beta-L-altrosamine N-acetyltransferase [Salinivibrio sp. VYel7]MPX90617.1 UDP-4-amino-4,6-dideoxy-N-acetyl-beta-L-altrosamine N-acetyltransferase [Salinivibrio sp. VYel1]MPX93853.1 UDP-4-amino-4,6-dideoxy-N-acetyl-beta-L-altrosamine N-acetyltransferase [Salinivibrio sp. VYel9]MPX96090.1 UDP-4-amino-4,6-dideoxy-N-acetyl-beta-L-altrosamine